MSKLAASVTLLASFVVVPSLVYAQASITGSVKDTSGGVLPGVTVEAASPALIEKTRAGVTDGTGQYRIENLRPGTYVVTFTLAGFSIVKREGVELAGSFTATVNAELRVGALEETITVTGETLVVDVQNTTQQRVIDHTIIDALPTAKNDRSLGLLVPGMVGSTAQDVGGALTNVQNGLTIHGSKGIDKRVTQNGVSKAAGFGGGDNTNVLPNMLGYQAVTFDTAAVSAEFPTGGVRINFIPKDGGNTFSGTLAGSFANHAMQSDNYTQALRDAGLAAPATLKELWDVNPGFGGPVKKDRLWFYGTVRYFVDALYPSGIRFNLNANNPDVWTYAPDPGKQPSNDATFKDGSLRLTWQATPKNKFGFSWTEQTVCYCLETISATLAPEAAIRRVFLGDRDLLFDWSSPVSNRLLLEAAGINRYEPVTRRTPQFSSPAMIAVTDQGLGNLTFRAPPVLFRDTTYRSYFVRAAASYITGAHAYKLGFSSSRASDPTTTFPPTQPVNYRFNNGVPNQITLFATPTVVEWQADADIGLYAQDRWTIGRLALSYGLRYDYFKTVYPAQTLGPGPLVPTRNLTLPEAPGVAYHDLAPKSGAAYDLFGNGKTALKVTLNKYLQGLGDGGDFGLALAPVNRLVISTTRAWNDANRNFVPDCDVTNLAANGECGAIANQNFGKSVPGTTYDPDTLSGWGKRGFNWEFSTGVQQELLPRVALSVNYFRRWYGNFIVTDNRAVAASDYTRFSLVAPGTDARLPNAGQKVAGLFDLNPSAFGRNLDNYLTFAKHYGRQIEHWNGFDVTIDARPREGVLIQGGLSSGRTVTDNCEVATQVPEVLFGAATVPFGSVNTNVWIPLEHCHQNSGFLTQVKLLGSYTIPRVDVQISGAFQSLPGPLILANYNAPNAVVAPSLGRNLSGNAANVSVELLPPGSLYGERLNEVDLRLAKILKVGRTRIALNLDVLNPFNSNPITGLNSTFGGATRWQTPQSILLARYAKVSAQIDF